MIHCRFVPRVEKLTNICQPPSWNISFFLILFYNRFFFSCCIVVHVWHGFVHGFNYNVYIPSLKSSCLFRKVCSMQFVNVECFKHGLFCNSYLIHTRISPERHSLHCSKWSILHILSFQHSYRVSPFSKSTKAC